MTQRDNTDPFEVILSLASDQGLSDLAGPWDWKGCYQIVASNWAVLAKKDKTTSGLKRPPTQVGHMIDKYGQSIGKRIGLKSLRDWAGPPLRLWCQCGSCGHEHRISTSYQPGTLGDCVIDRRLVALALELAPGKQATCLISTYVSEEVDCRLAYFYGASWWAIVMGLCEAQVEGEAPRFEL